MEYTILFIYTRNKQGISRRTKLLKDTHREKALSNKTSALTESKNVSIWVVDTSDQLFVRGS